MPYFSARLLYVILVGTRSRRRNECDETVIVFRARDFDDAFRRALVLGRRAETEYPNSRGERVRWSLVEIQTLDQIGTRLDGTEVASKLHTRVFLARSPHEVAFTPNDRSQVTERRPASLGAEGKRPAAHETHVTPRRMASGMGNP